MSTEISGVAEALFEKIRARFEGVSVGDGKAKATQDPKEARFFNFDYLDDTGTNFGNVTVSIIDERSLKIYFGKNLSANLDEHQKAEWYDFLRDMRMFAKRNLMNFDTRDISRSNLNIKDIKQLSATEAPIATIDSSVTEGKMFGTTKTSYETISPGTRLIVRHSAAVDEAIHGARSRKIQSVYVEDAEGQRFKAPFTHLGGSRALARHVASGGVIGDDFSNHIVEIVQEMGKIKKFIQGSRNKVYEDDEANKMVDAAKQRYQNIHHILQKLAKHKSYKFYREQWKPSSTLQDDIDLESLRGKFVQKDFDNRLEDALPHVYAAYHAMKDEPEEQMKPAFHPQVDEFCETMDTIEEGTWALPEDDLQIKKLQELMSDVLVAGIDGADATGALYDILGDDELYDRIYDAAQGSPEMDVRPIVYDWLQDNMPDVGAKVDAALKGGSAEPEPQEDSTTESIMREDRFVSEYYSIECDSAPYYLHSTKFLESAQKALQSAQERGRKDAKLYEIKVINGKKIKSEYNTAMTLGRVVDMKESSALADIRRLAGLSNK